MLDLHTHILPQMDDGSKSPEETRFLLEALSRQGVTSVAATPHFYAKETPAAFLKRRQEAAAQLDAPMEILLGAEVAYFGGMGNCEDLIPLRIGNTKFLLVEMPFNDWSDRVVEDVCSIPVQLGLIPVLAHINRYPGKQQFPKYKDILLQSGIYFQCNAEAFLAFMNRQRALNLMKNGYIHFLGSDCHNLSSRPPLLDKANAAIEKKFGRAFLARFHKDAERILFDE